MRDGNGGSALDQVFQGQLNFAFRLGIDRRSGFVEYQDARIDQQCPGDADALPFAAGEKLSAFAHQRIVAVGQAQDEFVRRAALAASMISSREASGRP